jgi:hypothetical protein
MCRLAAFGLAIYFLANVETTQAQIVRWGPDGTVSIRAPFVDVDVAPGGNTRVRAPFTAVDTPGFGPYLPRYERRFDRAPANRTPGRGLGGLRPLSADEYAQDTVSTSQKPVADPALMSWLELRRHTRAVAVRLENELRRVADGTLWTASLRPGTVRDLLAEDSDQPPNAATIDQLAAILQSYDTLVDSDGYPQIARLSGFREMREALGEMVLPPQERGRRNLVAQWNAFYRDLDRFETGATWQKYLQLPPGLRDERAAEKQTLRQLEDLLGRYEKIIGPEEYRAVTELPSFRATRQGLADYVAILKESAANAAPEMSLPEAVPLPRPLP